MAKKKKKALKKLPMPKEEWEQRQIFIWRKKWIKEIPRLKLLHGSLSGIRLTPGLRSKNKLLGNTDGIPDISFPAKDVLGKYPGLYIELKRRGFVKNVSDEQKKVMKMLADEGHCTCVCEGFHEAIDIIADWLGMSEEERWSKEIDGLRPKF